MHNWQSEVNYKKIKKTDGEINLYLIKIGDGRWVEVNEKIYNEYSKSKRRERYISYEKKSLSLDYIDERLVERISYMQNAGDLSELYINKEMYKKREETLEKVLKLIKTLPSNEKDIVEKIYLQSISIAEIAEEYGVSYKTIVHRKNKAISKIRKLLLLG